MVHGGRKGRKQVGGLRLWSARSQHIFTVVASWTFEGADRVVVPSGLGV